LRADTEDAMAKFDTLVEIFTESTKRFPQQPLFGEKRDGALAVDDLRRLQREGGLLPAAASRASA
jgi:hypothetical protein